MATIGRYTCWSEMGYGAIWRQMRELQAERHLGAPLPTTNLGIL